MKIRDLQNKIISIEEFVDSLPDRTNIDGYGFSLERKSETPITSAYNTDSW